ncbi:permease prefix domain 1-containing protein [Amycolatopsis jejuensis]|uniref:permease prefix domain 1-containing protein n=1 Tax=Amycolatopsis jejuensis TaxID=330084 RepID=UPI00052765B7|nr:permease prefix domain 1-containing protein [Amycolatopsis jejuensis]
MNAIDGYLAELDRQLVGSRSAKADLLAEARDGLHDAAEAYREGGWSAEDAQRRAVADFGHVGEVAGDYQAELSMHSGVRTLWKVVLGVPAMQTSWELARILTFGSWAKLTTPNPGWYPYVTQFSHGAIYAVPFVGLVALVCARWLSRRVDGAVIARICGVLIAVAVGLNLVSVGLIVGATGVVDASRLFLSVPCGVLMVAWVLLSLRFVVLVPRPRRLAR